MTFARLLAVLAVVLAAAVAGVSNANATTTSECQAQLAQLRADTVAAESSFTNARSFTSAVGKVDAARRELDKGKNLDAVTKLGDFQSLLAQLAGTDKPKLDPVTAGALSAQAQGVIDCIKAIETV